MRIDLEQDLAYEHLTMLINEFEKAALESNTREGVLAATNSPLKAMDAIMESSRAALTRVDNVRSNLTTEDGQRKTVLDTLKEGGTLAEVDKDLLELFGGPDNPVKNYLEECLGCNLRLKFDWQLKPIDLLAPINGMIDSINAALDRLLRRINPLEILKDICNLLNGLRIFCPPDLIMLLMALKMLLKRYMMASLNIKLDWTILLGPLLNALLQGIVDLFQNLLGILLAPIDCAINALTITNNFLKEARDFALAAEALVGSLDEIDNSLESNFTWRKTDWETPETQDPRGVVSAGSQGYNPGRLKVQNKLVTKDDPIPKSEPPFITGFQLRSDMTISDAMRDPAFGSATGLEALIIPLQEAKQWLIETSNNINSALLSLQGLVGGGLSINLDNLGVMLFILDMISLVMMIIKMLKMNPDVKDWCKMLELHPEIVEKELAVNYGDIKIEPIGQGDDTELLLRKGPDIVGSIKTCANARSDMNIQMLNQWVSDLQIRGASE